MKQKIMFRAHNKRNTKTTRKKKGGEQKKSGKFNYNERYIAVVGEAKNISVKIKEKKVNRSKTREDEN